MEIKRIINFSGGLSSALMTILEYNKKTDLVIFADTGREHPKTYKFISDFEKNENIPVMKLQYKNEYGEGFTALYQKKKTMLPNRQFRTCTVELKINPVTKYCRQTLKLKKFDWIVGFRYDEEKRVKNYSCQKYKNPLFPLYEKKIRLEDVNKYWSNKCYTLEIPRILGNCDLCFLKGKNNLIKIMQHYPELAQKWIDDEKRNGKTFIKDISYSQLLEISKKQGQLFELNNLESAYPNCKCSIN